RAVPRSTRNGKSCSRGRAFRRNARPDAPNGSSGLAVLSHGSTATYELRTHWREVPMRSLPSRRQFLYRAGAAASASVLPAASANAAASAAVELVKAGKAVAVV